MNKADVTEALKRETGLTRHEAERLVEIFFAKISDALASGNRVEIRGFCSFFVKQYEAYTGRNPKTQEPVKVNPKRLPFFKCGKELKQRVDY